MGQSLVNMSLNKLISFSAAGVLITVMCLFSGCGNQNPIFSGRYEKKNRIVTQKGVEVFNESGPVVAAGPAIERGIETAIGVATSKRWNWTKRITLPEHYVGLMPTSDKCKNPAFLMTSPGLDGSEWDKDPEPGRALVCIAGVTVDFAYPGKCGFIIANHPQNWEIASHYEAEHCLAWANDPAFALKTSTHAEGSGHPILGGPEKFRAPAYAHAPVTVGGKQSVGLLTQ